MKNIQEHGQQYQNGSCIFSVVIHRSPANHTLEKHKHNSSLILAYQSQHKPCSFSMIPLLNDGAGFGHAK